MHSMETNQNYFFIIFDLDKGSFIRKPEPFDGSEIHVLGVEPENATRLHTFEQAKYFILENLTTPGDVNCSEPGSARALYWLPQIIRNGDFSHQNKAFVYNRINYSDIQTEMRLIRRQKRMNERMRLAKRKSNVRKSGRFTYGDFIDLLYTLIILFGFLAILLICIKIIYN